ncbi:MAG: FAD:protein FMN transferase, partial [Pedobacter sp.]
MFFIKQGLIIGILLLIFLSSKKDQRQYTIHGYAQGTDYTIKYFATDSLVTKSAVDSILVKIDSSMSLYKSYSLINQFNTSKDGIQLDQDFERVIRKSFEVYNKT